MNLKPEAYLDSSGKRADGEIEKNKDRALGSIIFEANFIFEPPEKKTVTAYL